MVLVLILSIVILDFFFVWINNTSTRISGDCEPYKILLKYYINRVENMYQET